MKKGIRLAVVAVFVLSLTVMQASSTGITFTADSPEPALPELQINIGDYIQLGKYNDVPILWRCMDINDEHGTLLLSDKILCAKAFDAAGKHDYDDLTGNVEKHGSNFWEDSNIRAWLNSTAPAGAVEWPCGVPPTEENVFSEHYSYADEKGFLAEGNFTESERSAMKPVSQWTLLPEKKKELATNGKTEVFRPTRQFQADFTVIDEFSLNDTSNMRKIKDSCQYQVTDTVFLLDELQVQTLYDNLGVIGAQRLFDGTQGVKYDWTLRSPVCRYAYAVRTCEDNADTYEFSYIYYANMTSSIRPAFYLNEATAQILSGSGTEEEPYVVDGKQIAVYVNGTELTLDVPPMLENDRTLVPMRAIFEALGAEVSWYPESRAIVAVRGGTTVFMQVDDWYMSVNDEWIALDAPPRIVNDRTLIPLRAVAEALGAQVGWDEEMQVVTVELD